MRAVITRVLEKANQQAGPVWVSTNITILVQVNATILQPILNQCYIKSTPVTGILSIAIAKNVTATWQIS